MRALVVARRIALSAPVLGGDQGEIAMVAFNSVLPQPERGKRVAEMAVPPRESRARL